MASPRRVAVAIVLSLPSTSSGPASSAPAQAAYPEPAFLLVSSRKKQHLYVFPKGGVEQGESAREAAEREAWEEAGLEIGAAQHLAHLLTLHDPSPHILSPTTDPSSPSFVSSCEYSFELFLLPPPFAAAGEAGAAPSTAAGESAAPSLPAAGSKAAGSATPSSYSSSSSYAPSSAPSPASPSLITTPTHPSLPSTWPESHERHRAFALGWAEAERRACWGRREDVMRQAVAAAKEWVEAWEARRRIVEEDGEEEEGEDEGGDGEGRRGSL